MQTWGTDHVFHPFSNRVDKVMIRNGCQVPMLISDMKDSIEQVYRHIYKCGQIFV